MRKLLFVLVALAMLCGVANAQRFSSGILFQNRPAFSPTRAGWFWRDGDVLAWRTSTSTVYTVTTSSPTGALDLGSLADVDTTTAVPGDVLVYDGVSGIWFSTSCPMVIPDPLILNAIQVDTISDKAGTGAPDFPNGLTSNTETVVTTNDLTNYVTTNTIQVITAEKTFNNRVNIGNLLRKNSTTHLAMVYAVLNADTTGIAQYNASSFQGIQVLNQTIPVLSATRNTSTGLIRADLGSTSNVQSSQLRIFAGNTLIGEPGLVSLQAPDDIFRDLWVDQNYDLRFGAYISNPVTDGNIVAFIDKSQTFTLPQTFSYIDAAAVTGLSVRDTAGTTQIYIGSIPSLPNGFTVGDSITALAGTVLKLQAASTQRFDLVDGGSRVFLRKFDDTNPVQADYGLIGNANGGQIVGIRGYDNGIAGATGVNARMRATSGGGYALDAEMAGVTLTGNISGPLARIYRSITLGGFDVIVPMFQVNDQSGAGNAATGDLMEIRAAQPRLASRAHLNFWAPNTVTDSDYILRAQVGGVGDVMLLDWDGVLTLDGGLISDGDVFIGSASASAHTTMRADASTRPALHIIDDSASVNSDTFELSKGGKTVSHRLIFSAGNLSYDIRGEQIVTTIRGASSLVSAANQGVNLSHGTGNITIGSTSGTVVKFNLGGSTKDLVIGTGSGRFLGFGDNFAAATSPTLGQFINNGTQVELQVGTTADAGLIRAIGRTVDNHVGAFELQDDNTGGVEKTFLFKRESEAGFRHHTAYPTDPDTQGNLVISSAANQYSVDSTQKTTVVTNDTFLIEDSAAANAKKWIKPTAFGWPFGTSFQYNTSAGESSYTGSTTFQQKVRITMPAGTPAGTYRIGWSFENGCDGDDKELAFRVQVDDTTDVMNTLVKEKGKRTDTPAIWNHKGGMGYVTLTAGSHTIDLDFGLGAGSTGDTTYIRRARLEVWRVQ